MLFHHISTTKPEEQTTMINFICEQVKQYCALKYKSTVRIHNGLVKVGDSLRPVGFSKKYFIMNNQEVPYKSITEIKSEPENSIAICYGYNRTLISSLLPSLFPGNNF